MSDRSTLYPWTKKKTGTSQGMDPLSFTELRARLQDMPPEIATLTIFLLGATTATTTTLLYKRFGRRIKNSEWVTPKLLTRRRWLKGVVTSVGDGDNFRFFHTPTFGGTMWPLKFRSMPTLAKDLKDETIHVRIAGVDAPEASHFGKPAQPYASESLAWLRNTIHGKNVYIQLLRKDQYSRIVAQVYLAPRILPGFLFYGKNVSAEMLKAGWAVTYEQAGAEYGRLGKEEYVRLEAQAKAARKGMWKDGLATETPAEYKRRQASAASFEKAEATRSLSGRKKPKSWLARLFSR